MPPGLEGSTPPEEGRGYGALQEREGGLQGGGSEGHKEGKRTMGVIQSGHRFAV